MTLLLSCSLRDTRNERKPCHAGDGPIRGPSPGLPVVPVPFRSRSSSASNEVRQPALTPRYIQENFEVSTLPEDAMQEIRDGITTRVRFNPVVETGVPGFIPQSR